MELKYSAIYFKIKSTFSRQSLLDKPISEADPSVSRRGNTWVELTDEQHSQSGSTERYGTTLDTDSLAGTSLTAHEHGFPGVKQYK
jgi:hypothetical protein